MIKRIVFGAMDPEMVEILAVAKASGIPAVQATIAGAPVAPPTANKADGPTPEEGDVWIECRIPGANLDRIDHHAPGDAGFGRPAAEAVEASSLGQFLARLGLTPTPVQRVIAALDHAAAAACQGKVPGVDAQSALTLRAHNQKVTYAQVEEAVAALAAAPRIDIGGGGQVTDLRGLPLPETRGAFDAGALPGLLVAGLASELAYVSEVRTRAADPNGPVKVVLGGAGDGTAAGTAPAAWLLSDANPLGLTGRYGDPARGFAGGYPPA